VKTIIIDSNCLGYIAKYSKGGLSYGEMETGVIFGFLEAIKNLSKRFDTKEFIFCWDSKKSKRRKLYPEYKANRNINRTETEQIEDNITYRQFYDLRTLVLPKLGFKNIFIQTGYESDDLIAILVEHILRHSLVVTNDDDLLQLLNYCDIYNPRTKKIIDYGTFESLYGIAPSICPSVKALAGCISDNIKGVEGVGKAKALAFIKNKLSEGKIKDRILNSNDILKRNFPLIRLPLKGTVLPIIQKDEKFYVDNFIDIFEKYNFKSFLKKENFVQWCELFKMEQ